jgi:hypothetical protein
MHPLIRQWLVAEHIREMCTRADKARLAAFVIRRHRRPRYRALLPGSRPASAANVSFTDQPHRQDAASPSSAPVVLRLSRRIYRLGHRGPRPA